MGLPHPIVIINRDRAEALEKLIAWCLGLERVGPVIVVDNCSTWEPTLDLYRRMGKLVSVVLLPRNVGRRSAREVGRELWFRPGVSRRVVVTDPDLVPYPDTPGDVLLRLDEVLDDYQQLVKAGPSLEVDDVPPNAFNSRITHHFETRRYRDPRLLTPCGRGHFAGIDSTFALYRHWEGIMGEHNPAVRLCSPYRLRHVDWYEDQDRPTIEYLNYVDNSSRESSGATLFRARRRDRGRYDALAEEAIRKDSLRVLTKEFLR